MLMYNCDRQTDRSGFVQTNQHCFSVSQDQKLHNFLTKVAHLSGQVYFIDKISQKLMNMPGVIDQMTLA